MRHLPRLLLAASLLLPAATLADSLRCPGGIVSVGDSSLDLLGKCGAPALREARGEERSRVRLDAAGRPVEGRSVAVTVQRWTYNFGPRQFVQHVELEGGRITGVVGGGYGYDLGAGPPAPAIPRARCGHLALRVGDSTFDLLARCGEPATRDVREVTRVTGGAAGGGAYEAASTTELIEVWSYDFGPQVLVRHLSVERGAVTQVGTGGYGYSR
ncbi:MAG: DUF2845 domain-containing protein [Anaeromyxobacter sp.]|nr:DUF2845 domain-containing protein [Anaeromyxobacter sp.]MBL0274914.1 DUF2845 domain-containing protein [Anaeromyxobacter sp.]